MIRFYSETDFQLDDQAFFSDWIAAVIELEQGEVGNINFVFCDDEYLLEINQRHLQHDYYTDIITFDYSEENCISGDLFISVDRVADNAFTYEVDFEQELSRAMVHGVLHMLGYDDSSEEDIALIRSKEDEYLSLQANNVEED
ncbi:MAG: rRNA maturation RNase YbeY [Weeksellaceae bacterium]|nr:rRNA maturation RNase YbeY [Weeksellaceae bacterium]